MPKIELVAPAGGWDQLIAAINAGADSVYLGYKKYGARAYAQNFDLDQLYRAVSLAHSRGVKVYLTLNTIIKDDEIPGVVNLLNKFLSFCRDGIIIQDYGICSIMKDLFPGTRMHASTQMNIHNRSSLRFLKDIGFKRAVLAREMTLEEITGLRHKDMIDIEVFGHGSQCFSYSGRCYFSSFTGGRSGNRGRCAQPCRMKYRISSEDFRRERQKGGEWSYFISKNDLCSLGLIPQMIEAGINALKIEGRMKTAEYTGLVVKTYRKYIDLYYKDPGRYSVKNSDLYKVRQIFSRDLCTGYLEEGKPADIISSGKAGSIGNFLGRIERIERAGGRNKAGTAYGKYAGNIFIKSRWPIGRGDILEIWTREGKRRIEIDSLELVNIKNKALYKIPLIEVGQLSIKDRVFKYFDRVLDIEARELIKNGDIAKNVHGFREENLYVSRKKIESYLGKTPLKRIKTLEKAVAASGKMTLARGFKEIKISVNIYNKGQIAPAVSGGADYIIINDFNNLYFKGAGNTGNKENIHPFFNVKSGKSLLVYNTPPISYDRHIKDIQKSIEKIQLEDECIFKVGNAGVLYTILKTKKSSGGNTGIFLGHDFNLSNVPSVNFFRKFIDRYKEINLMGIDLSPEINIDEISQITTSLNKEGKKDLIFSIFGHGYFPVVNARYSFNKPYNLKTGKNKISYLEDQKGYRFRIDTDFGENMVIYNSKRICSFFDLDLVACGGVGNLIIDGLFYTEEEIEKITRLYREAINILLSRGKMSYKAFVSKWQNDPLFGDYTRGHLIRGVE